MLDQSRFVKVADLITNGEPRPEWLLPALQDFSGFISVQRANRKDEGDVEARMVSRARYLRDWLPMYERLGEYGLIDCPDCVKDIQPYLDEVIEFLEKDVVSIVGTPRGRADYRGRLCAAVVGEASGIIRLEVQPNSRSLQQACQAYWQACGQEQTGEFGLHENWIRELNWVRGEGDAWVRRRLEQVSLSHTTSGK
jgi:hypothetical protein